MSDAMRADPNRPIVSVIIPSYNHADYVEDAIQSVLEQDYRPLELIVVDDCSKDDSAQLLSRLAHAHGFVFVRNDKNVGLNATLETGLSLASGEYVSILASDDAMLPGKISGQIDYLVAQSNDAVYGTCYTLFEDGRRELVDLGDLAAGFADGTALKRIYTDSSNAPLLQSALIRRKCLMGLWEERCRFKSDDWVTLIRLLERYRVGFVSKPQFLYRQHSNNTYRNYWGTFPMRAEVISEVTPEPLRALGLSNMFRDQALFLYMDGKKGTSFKFLLASMMLDPRPAKWMTVVIDLSRRALRKAFRLPPRL